MKIRIVSPEDAPALLEIYAPYVRETAVSFEHEVPSLAEFKDRILHTLKDYPYLAAEEDGRLLGYTYASRFKSRAAYDWSVETTIYVRRDERHRGTGSALYRSLEDCLRRQNVCNLCACIAYPNPDSIAFHKAFGYVEAAHFHQSGYKLGAWQDMIWMERTLCPHSVPPAPFLPFSQLDPDFPDTRKELL